MTAATQCSLCERIIAHAVLLPAENIALTVARGQLQRGENPPVNTTTVLVMALDRLTGPAPAAASPAPVPGAPRRGEEHLMSAPSPGRAAAYPHCPCCRPGCRARHDEPCEHEPARPAEGAGTEKTPARAAYETFWANRPPVTGTAVAIPASWDSEPPEVRDQWAAAAQAAIDESDSTALAQLAMAREAISDLAAERDEARADAARLRELQPAPAPDRQGDETAKPAPELAAAMAETRRVAETVRPVLDCFKRASDGWRGRVSAVILARAYAATGTVPDYLKHAEGQ